MLCKEVRFDERCALEARKVSVPPGRWRIELFKESQVEAKGRNLQGVPVDVDPKDRTREERREFVEGWRAVAVAVVTVQQTPIRLGEEDP